MTTNGEAIMAGLEDRSIRYMTYVLLFDAPDSVFDRWLDSLGTDWEHEILQSTWRIILQVEAATAASVTSDQPVDPATCPHCCCTYTTECCYCDGSRTPLENT